MQKILSINEVKVYSRKQIIAWVQSYNYNFDQLKNGLFFLKILSKLVPHDINRNKYCEKPINQYQQTQNMNIVKKILNKHNLQLNMNVLAIIAAKNCFQLANWFKNLYQQNKSDTDTDFHYSEKSHTPSKFIEDPIVNIMNYKSLSRATSSDKKNSNKIKKLGRVTSGFIGIKKTDNLQYTVKLSKPAFDSQLTYKLYSTNNPRQKPAISTSKSPKYTQMRSAKSRSKHTSKLTNNWASNSIIENKKQPLLLNQQQNIVNLMKIQSFQQQIQVFQQILLKIDKYVRNMDNQKQNGITMDKMRQNIKAIIYKNNIQNISNKENGTE